MSVILKAPAVKAGTPHKSNPQVVETVSAVLDDIRSNGDAAVRKYSEQFDRWAPESFRLTEDQVAKIVADLPTTVIDENVTARTFDGETIEIMAKNAGASVPMVPDRMALHTTAMATLGA